MSVRAFLAILLAGITGSTCLLTLDDRVDHLERRVQILEDAGAR